MCGSCKTQYLISHILVDIAAVFLIVLLALPFWSKPPTDMFAGVQVNYGLFGAIVCNSTETNTSTIIAYDNSTDADNGTVCEFYFFGDNIYTLSDVKNASWTNGFLAIAGLILLAQYAVFTFLKAINSKPVNLWLKIRVYGAYKKSLYASSLMGAVFLALGWLVFLIVMKAKMPEFAISGCFYVEIVVMLLAFISWLLVFIRKKRVYVIN